jgi:ribonuclease BN (tRNA processing enzyme)
VSLELDVIDIVTRATHSVLVAALLVAVGCVHSSQPVHDATAATGPGDHCVAIRPPHSRFELVVVGSGGPGAFGRAASSYVVFIDGSARVLVDIGPGAFVRLGEMSVDFAALDTLLLTHLHIDHAGDLPGFVKSRDLMFDGPQTFRIFGPVGGGEYPSTTAFIDRLFGPTGAFAYLSKFRNDLRFVVSDLPTQPQAAVHELLHEDDLRVTSISVDHDDVPAVAYRVEHAGHAVVISGDLASKNDNLARLATGADLLVYDTAVLDPPGSPTGLYDLHTPPRRIGEIAAAARVRTVLLSHLPPAVERAHDEVLKSVRSTFNGEARLAEDCMRVDLMRQ